MAAQGGAACGMVGVDVWASGERVVPKVEERRVVIASSVGTALGWYDTSR